MDPITQKKAAFAALLYKDPGVNPMKIAMQLFSDTGDALRISQEWPRDPFILDEIARLADEQSTLENHVPTKEDLCREVWSWIAGDKSKFVTFDERIKAAKLFAELNKMIEKPEPAKKDETPETSWPAFEIPVHGDDEQWEKDLAANQRKLQAEGARLVAESEGKVNDEA